LTGEGQVQTLWGLRAETRRAGSVARASIGRRQRSKLLHDAYDIELRPVLGNLAVHHPAEVNAGRGDVPARGWDPLKGALRGAGEGARMPKPRVYRMSFAGVYPLYIAKAEKKGRTKAEVDEIIRWLTGYGQQELEAQLEQQTDLETFFAEADLNPSRALIKGVVCGVRVEDIEEPTMQEIRYLDKLIDELAKGRSMEKILRKA
jgi:hypothetical protein